MQMDPAQDEERLRFFEDAIVQAKQDYEVDNTDAQALTRWGGALLELAHLHRGERAWATIEEAIEKLKVALELDGRKHNALWCLGNAYTSKGFLVTEDREAAHALFKKALDCFVKALEEDPENKMYRRAVEVTEKAPEIYEELQRHLGSEKAEATEGLYMAGASNAGTRKNSSANEGESSDSWWDMAGWVCLVGVAAMVLIYSHRGLTSS